MANASVQEVKNVILHPNADKLDVVTVLGWNVVSLRNEFKIGEKCVYIEIDTIVDEKNPAFEFLREKNYRIKTIRLRGQLSQGIVFPVSILPKDTSLEIGTDVSEILNIKHYEKPVARGGNGTNVGSFGKTRTFPSNIISKTDEVRIQSIPAIVDFLQGREVYASIKHDGTSSTYIKQNGKLRVCSRNMELFIPTWYDKFVMKIKNFFGRKYKIEKNVYVDIAGKYNLAKNIPDNYAIQGEIVGPSIQGNEEELNETELRVFNVKNLETGEYLSYEDFKTFCKDCELTPVDEYYVGVFKWNNHLEMLEEADKARYKNGKQAEGIVWRLKVNEPCHMTGGSYLSFKTVSNKYLLGHDE